MSCVPYITCQKGGEDNPAHGVYLELPGFEARPKCRSEMQATNFGTDFCGKFQSSPWAKANPTTPLAPTPVLRRARGRQGGRSRGSAACFGGVLKNKKASQKARHDQPDRHPSRNSSHLCPAFRASRDLSCDV